MKPMQEICWMSQWRAWCLALGLAMGATAMAQTTTLASPTVIRSISSTQQAGVEVVRIELSEPLAAIPNGFTVQTPPRIAIDLPGVLNGIGRSMVEINQGNMRSANVAQTDERTRIVLNLRLPSSYRAELQGNALLIVLDAAPAVAAAVAGSAPAPVHFAQSLNTAPQALRDIDFRRGQDGAGRIIVDPDRVVGGQTEIVCAQIGNAELHSAE